MVSDSKIKLAILNTHPIQYFTPLYKKLACENNIDLTVLYCSRWGLEEYVDPQFNVKFKWDIPLLDGYNYKFLKNLRKTEDVNKFFNLINFEIVRELARNRYDALWVNGHNNFTNIIAILEAKFLGIKLLMRAETQLKVETNNIKEIIRKPVMKTFYKLFDGFLSLGSRNKDYYKYLNIDDKKLFFVPYTVDNDFFIEKVNTASAKKKEILGKYVITVGNLNILYASKLMKRKNPMHLLQAFQSLKKRLPNINLLFAGSGEEENKLKAYVGENNIKDVYFTGFVNQSELPEVFAVSDVFVLPAINEQWGLIINEAMCAGLPVITTDVVGAAPDLVKDGINGFTFKAGDIKNLDEKLFTILNNKELRVTMGKNSREIIRRWSYHECITGIQKALETVLN